MVMIKDDDERIIHNTLIGKLSRDIEQLMLGEGAPESGGDAGHYLRHPGDSPLGIWATAKSDTSPPLTMEKLMETWRKVRQAGEIKLGNESINMLDYTVREWGAWVVLIKHRAYQSMQKFDFIVIDPAEGKAYVLKTGRSQIEYDFGEIRETIDRGLMPRVEINPYLAIPRSFAEKTILISGIACGGEQSIGEDTPAKLVWPEVLCLTDADFFEIYDVLEVVEG